MNRRDFVLSAFAGGATVLLGCADGSATPAAGKMVIYKSPTCGCCTKWVDYIKANNFATEVHDLANVGEIKAKHHVPADLVSCHTALIDNYVLEGHVPVDVITQLLSEKPAITGLAVPGMPVGTPGMEMGSRKDSYDVIAFTQDGKTSVYASR